MAETTSTRRTSRKKLPSTEQGTRPLPSSQMNTKELPQVGLPENTVMIGGKLIEIKPTKLKYQRNHSALFYKMLQIYPVVDLMVYPAGSFGDDRDGDKCIMDFLIAATDDEKLIVDNYEEMDTDTIEKILSIFLRVNKITEKEERRKNQEAEKKTAE